MLAFLRVLLLGVLILGFTTTRAGAVEGISMIIVPSGSVGPTGVSGFQGSVAVPFLSVFSTNAAVSDVRAVQNAVPSGGAKAAQASKEPVFVASIAKPATAGGAPTLTLWTVGPLSERTYRGVLVVGTARFSLNIAVSAPHDLKADGTTSKVYVVANASGSIMLLLKSALGLQDTPNGEVRLRIENDSELSSAVSIRRVVLYDANGVPVLSPVLKGTFKRRVRRSSDDLDAITNEAEPKSESIQGGGSALVYVDLTGKPIQPGTYTGFVEIESPDPMKFTPLPFKLDVRDYPFAVMLLMIVFTFVGYMVFWLSGPRQAYAQQLASIDSSLQELRQLPGHNDDACDRLQKFSVYMWQRVDPDCAREATEPQGDKTREPWLTRFRNFLRDVWPWTASSKPDPTLDASLSTDIASLRAIIGAGIRLSQLTHQAEGELSKEQNQALQPQIMKVWKSIVQIDPIGATGGISQIVGELFEPDTIVTATDTAAAPVGPEKPADGAAGQNPQPLRAALTRSDKNPTVVRSYLGGTTIRMVTHVPNNIQTIQNVRRLTSAVGIFILFSIGMNVLYINVSGFGHSVYDYIKVIAWSFTTGAAGRGLSTTIGTWAQNLLF